MDLNKLRAAVEAKNNGEVLQGVDKMAQQPKGAAYQRYLDFKYATPDKRGEIAKENETTEERYEASLLMLANLRKEVPVEEERKEGE